MLGEDIFALSVPLPDISFTGIITFKNAHSLRDIALKMPNDRIFLETDSPFLAPTPYRGKRNEPAFIKSTAAYISEFKQITFDELATKTTLNFYKLFSKAEKPQQKQTL